MTLQKGLAIDPEQPPVIDQQPSTLSLSHQLEFSQSGQNLKWHFLLNTIFMSEYEISAATETDMKY